MERKTDDGATALDIAASYESAAAWPPRHGHAEVAALLRSPAEQAAFEGDGGIDLPAARARLEERREALLKEQVRVGGMLNTFQRVARMYQSK